MTILKTAARETKGYHDRVALANDIGRFFVRKIERIRFDIDAVDVDHTARDALLDDLMLVNSTQLFSDFQPLKEEDGAP